MITSQRSVDAKRLCIEVRIRKYMDHPGRGGNRIDLVGGLAVRV